VEKSLEAFAFIVTDQAVVGYDQ